MEKLKSVAAIKKPRIHVGTLNHCPSNSAGCISLDKLIKSYKGAFAALAAHREWQQLG